MSSTSLLRVRIRGLQAELAMLRAQHIPGRRIVIREEVCSTQCSAGLGTAHQRLSEAVQSPPFSIRFTRGARGRGGPPRTFTTPVRVPASCCPTVVDPVDPTCTDSEVENVRATMLGSTEVANPSSTVPASSAAVHCVGTQTPSVGRCTHNFGSSGFEGSVQLPNQRDLCCATCG